MTSYGLEEEEVKTWQTLVDVPASELIDELIIDDFDCVYLDTCTADYSHTGTCYL